MRYDERECRVETVPAMEMSYPSSSPEQLMAILQVPPDQEIRDLEFVLKQSREFDSNSMSCGATIIANPRFQNWLVTSETGLLYVEGQLDSSKFGKTSPISYFSANLAQLFMATPVSIVIQFFCGQHVACNNEMQGPQGLIRSFLAQLLQHWNEGASLGIDLADFTSEHEGISMETLCQIFEILLKQVPKSSTVFCIIDDLAQFEREKWDEDYWHFLRMLGFLVMNQDSSVRFKVLLTTSTKSKRLQEQIPEEYKIQVTERDRVMGYRKQQMVFR